MSINLFFLHSFAYEISRKDLFVLLLYGCVSPFYIHVACQERVQYIESINRVTLYSICLCRYIIQLKALDLMSINDQYFHFRILIKSPISYPMP